MVDEAARLIGEVRQIKTQYVAEVGRGRRVWPRSIKERIAQLDDLGIPAKVIAEKTEVPYETIILWRYKRRNEKAEAKTAFHELSVAERHLPQPISKSVTVTLPTNEMPLHHPEPSIPAKFLRLTTPDGFVIDGLDEASVVALLARLAPGGGGHAS